MNNQEKLLSYIESLYRLNGNDAVREVIDTNNIYHSIKLENFDFTSAHINMKIMPEVYILDIKHNKLLNDLPEFYNNSSDLAKNVFLRLERVAEDIKKAVPLSDLYKSNLEKIISNYKKQITFKHLDMGEDFINQCKIHSEKLHIFAYEEFNNCHKTYIYRTTVKSSDNKIQFPETYNSINSNDYKFAQKIFNLMRSYVR